MTKRMMSLGDPRLRGMNDTQWVFELEAMNLQEKERYDDLRMISNLLKKEVITMLGLNQLPVEDPHTKLLRRPEDHECLPLIAFIGSEVALSTIKQKQEELENQEHVQQQLAALDPLTGSSEPVDLGINEMSPEQLDEFMKDEGDVEFENAPADFLKSMQWGGHDTQALLEHLVLSKDDLGEDPLNPSPGRTIRQARADVKSQLRSKRQVQGIDVEEIDLGSKTPKDPEGEKPAVILEVK